MADVNANIGVHIDASDALAQLKSLQRQLSQFHTSVAKSSATAASAQAALQKNLLNSINSIGAFSAELRTVKTSAESFTNSLEKNKFSMREYFRYAAASTRTFGRAFTSELDTVNKVAEDRVKKLQTQYIKVGRDAQGAMKAMAIMPNQLDMSSASTQLQLAAQKQAIFNQLLKQGSTNLLNFGKNTQWAGRQLMVGFTLPLASLGMTASKTFMEMETAAIKFKKVYGDLLTPKAETQAALEGIQNLAKEFTKYGIAVSETVGLAADAAAAGFQGLDLQRQTTEATRLSVLGQIDAQQALETTIALQNAFKMSSEDLADSINFLNAVENQTVTSLDDITIAIPKVAPVIQQLGGDVKDLAFFLTAMKQGGINASEGANALKSGLAALINPTAKASAMLSGFGINIKQIVESNKGDIKSTVIDFALALDKLDPLNRAKAIEQLFGKFQFARLSTLFSNVILDGTQASKVLDLAGASVKDLAALSESELGMTAESSMNKFRKAVEDLKLALVPVGESFLKAVTPIVEFFGGLLEKFSGLSDNTKKIITGITIAIGGIGPIALMTFGLLANGIANIIKLFATLRSGYLRLTGQSQILGEQTQYMTDEQLNAAAAAHSLNQSHATLKQTFDVEKASLDQLIASYRSGTAAARAFAAANPGAMLPIPGGRKAKKYANGKPYVVGGSGNKDSEPAMLTPGETVIPAKMSKKYGGLINGMIAGNIPGYAVGKKSIAERSANVPNYGDLAVYFQLATENRSQRASIPGLANVLAPLVARIGEARGLGFESTAQSQYPSIAEEYQPIVKNFLGIVEEEFNKNSDSITSSSERLAVSWRKAGGAIESMLEKIASPQEKDVVRRALGLDEDYYGTIAGNFRNKHGYGGRTSRRGDNSKPASYVSKKFRGGASAAYRMLTGSMPAGMDYGHVFDLPTRKKMGLPTTTPLQEILNDPTTDSTTAKGLRTSIAKAEADAKMVGTQSGKAYIKAVKKETKDPYVASRDRKSPHRLAPKDGADDGKAYSTAVQKSIARHERKLAKRNNSVASGMQVSQSTKKDSKKTKVGNNAKAIGGRAAGMLGGARGIGISSAAMMASQFLPGQAGQIAGQASGLLFLGQTLNQVFGSLPGQAKLAGAALGLAAYGVKKLTDAHRRHEEAVGKSYTASSEVISMFGGTIANQTPKIHIFAEGAKRTNKELSTLDKNVNAIKKLKDDNPLKVVSESLKDMDTAESVIGTVRQFASAQVANGMDPSKVSEMVTAMLTYAGQTKYLKSALKEVTNSTKDADTATFTWIRKLKASATYIHPLTTSYKLLNTEQKRLADGSLQVLNRILDSNTSFSQAIGLAGQLTNALGNTGSAYKTLALAAKEAGDKQTAALLGQLRAQGTDLQTGLLMLKVAQTVPLDPKTMSKKEFKDTYVSEARKQLEAEQKAARDTNAKLKADYNASVAAAKKQQVAEEKSSLSLAEKQLKILEDKLKAEKDRTAEIKKQQDFLDSQQDLDQKIIEAKMSGNYLLANQLQQEKAFNASSYKDENKQSELEKQIEAQRKEVERLRSVKDKQDSIASIPPPVYVSVPTDASIATAIDKLTLALNGIMKKLGLDKDVSPGIDVGKKKAKVIKGAKTLREAASQADIGDRSKEIVIPDNERLAGLQVVVFEYDGKTYAVEKNGVGIYRFDSKNNTVVGDRIKNADQIKKKARGGYVSGPGSQTSDSIPAMLSNGEYVIKASAVAKYGKGFLDSINSGRYSLAGLASGGYAQALPSAGISASAGSYGNRLINSLRQQSGMNSNASSYNPVYNNHITISGTDLSKKEIADEVLYRISVVQKRNNMGNKVTFT